MQAIHTKTKPQKFKPVSRSYKKQRNADNAEKKETKELDKDTENAFDAKVKETLIKIEVREEYFWVTFLGSDSTGKGMVMVVLNRF